MFLRKKTISLALFTAMCTSLVTPVPIGATQKAPWSEKEIEKIISDTIEWLPEDSKFTHNEYKGINYTNTKGEQVQAVDVWGINREEATTYTTPYQDVESARIGALEYKKEASKYYQLLTGENENWDLTVVQNAEQAQKFLDGGFMNPDYNMDSSDGWKNVQLPASWTSYGFDFSIYTNVQMPWQNKYDQNVPVPQAPINYNPVGLYRKNFTVNEDMIREDGRIYISFEGVESAYYVYINGKEVGYSEDSYSPHKFDITDYLNPQGEENTLAVKVHKFCDGTWMEDQDMIYDGGIFRDVYLTSKEEVQIHDFTVVTDLDENFQNADLKVNVDIRNISDKDISNYSVDVKLFDELGENILENNKLELGVDKVGAKEIGTVSGEKLIENPKLWSAEDPNLYTLVLTLIDKNTRKEIESTSQQLGFREINFTSSTVDGNYQNTTQNYQTMTINGKPLLMKGTNRHDTDPIYGKHIPRETAEKDVEIMKQNNINAIRTSHYSNDEYLYYLADKYGLYVMGETNLESHAIANDVNTMAKYFTNLSLDRTNTNLERLKNRTSVVMWSIGNEMGYTTNGGDNIFPKLIWYFKDRDDTRPVHSEGQGWNGGVDTDSNMYPSVDYVWSKASTSSNKTRMPYVLCEYSHAMGNAVGNLKEYWDAIRSSENMIGAFVWDWVDQSRVVSLENLPKTFEICDMSSHNSKGLVYGDGIINDADEGSLTGKSYKGYTVMDSENNDMYNKELSGTGATFTFEAVVKPESNARNSVLVAKGDYQVALKTQSSGEGLEFFVYNNNNWYSCAVPFPENWAGNWHQVAGTFDGNTLKVYCDGELLGSKNYSGAIASSGDQLGIGYDVSRGRRFAGEMSLARVYTEALTAEELKAQYSTEPAIKSNDSRVLAWVDYSAPINEKESPYWDYYASSDEHQDLYNEEMDGKFFGYGGDWGDSPNDNDFCVNGLVSPDRDIQPELYEVKYQYQSLWFNGTEKQVLNKKIEVYNENNFINMNEYDVVWELLEDGKVIDNGTITEAVNPKERKEITVPYNMPEETKAGGEYFLNISAKLKEDILWAKKGHEVAYEQFEVPATVSDVAAEINGGVKVEESETQLSVSGNDFNFTIDRATGIMQNYTYKGELLMQEGPKPNFWRGILNNDSGYDGNWKNGNKNITAEDITVQTSEDGRTVITTSLKLNSANGAKETIVYTVNGSGEITVNLTVDAVGTGMGRYVKVGSTMVLPEGYENVTWYGDGPVESYQDRNTFARVGIYENTASNFFYPFLSTQDTGNLTGVKWISVTNPNSQNGLLVSGTNPIEASALHFTAEELDDATHPYELGSPRKDTILSLDYKSQGNGNSSCGPQVLEQYRLYNDKAYNYEYTIIPYQTTEDPMELSKAWRNIESFDQSGFDKAEAQKVIDEINKVSFVYSYKQYDAIMAAKSKYDNLSDSQKELVSNYSKLEAAIEKLATLEGAEPAYLKDSSKNELNTILTSDSIMIEDEASKYKMSGSLEIKNTAGENGGDIFADVIKGKKPFTIEAWVKPTSTDKNYNMIMGKGDSSFGFRTRPGNNGTISYDFFIKATNGNWYSVETNTPLPENWVGSLHQLVGTYDGATLSFYVDGQLVGSKADGSTGGVASNNTSLWIGYDPETNRNSDYQFASTRVYGKALTAEEVEIQKLAFTSNSEYAINPQDDSVVMWMDMANLVVPTNGTVDPGEIIVQKPSNLTSEVTKETATLTWQAPESSVGLVSYVIYKDGKEVAEVSKDQLNYNAEGLKANTIYGFKVVSKYSNGETSKPVSINLRTSK
ncbi:glycoside hydrolase family 2 TIM barrel-domain containing protein [Clostridium sp.]|uniref:glycoside hydrolase family 2 TIM barrel-domain containing protein n=1 Tax=Clostridium sp. TaxID=1506 RepID=UPI003F417B46